LSPANPVKQGPAGGPFRAPGGAWQRVRGPIWRGFPARAGRRPGSAAILGQVAEQRLVAAAAEAAVLFQGQPEPLAGRAADLVDLAQAQLDGAAAVIEGADRNLV